MKDNDLIQVQLGGSALRTRKYLIYELLLSGGLMALLVLSEAVDLPHYLLRAVPTSSPQRWDEILIQVALFALFLGCQIWFIQKLRRRLCTLQGFIRICCHCKQVFDEEKWEPVELFVEQHSDARFSHGICPECVEKHHPDLAAELRADDPATA